MRLYERNGQTVFPMVANGHGMNKKISYLEETRNGIPYCFLFVVGEHTEAQARVDFEKYIQCEGRA